MRTKTSAMFYNFLREMSNVLKCYYTQVTLKGAQLFSTCNHQHQSTYTAA
uniref:Uncharacterized protein n=1 Tax=Arion vulgaris TaxID=1028688 RepID=A0A0B7A157_9EUPU